MDNEGVRDLSDPGKSSSRIIEIENSQKSIMTQVLQNHHKRKSLSSVQFSPRKKLHTRKPSHPDRNWSNTHYNATGGTTSVVVGGGHLNCIPSENISPILRNKTPQQQQQETVILINPCASKILPSHAALEDCTSRSTMPETAIYPSVLQNAGSSFVIPETSFNLAANTGGYMVPTIGGMASGGGAGGGHHLSSAYMPLSTLDNDEIDGDQYHEIMQGLLQAIHNQNRIMEECRNILTSIHRAIVPFQPLPNIMVPPISPQLPLNLSSQPAIIANAANLWENNNVTVPPPSKSPTPSSLPQGGPTQSLPQQALNNPQQALAGLAILTNEDLCLNVAPPAAAPTTNNNVSMNASTGTTSMTFNEQPQPASKTTQTSLSKEPEKPAVFGPDGEFSSAYLRFVHGKSSTATSFANVLMKEVFTLEERISSNCNGVMGKKALEANRLDKIKRAVRRFYTDTEEEFQDMWKKCRKSIDSTNRNLKFVIMKKPNL